MANKFKVGDKVKRVCSPVDDIMYVGSVHEVYKVAPDGDIMLKGLEEYRYWYADYFELVEEDSSVDDISSVEDESPKFKEMVFESNSEEEAKLIQDALFELGYEWASVGKQYAHVKSLIVSTDKNGYISWGHWRQPTHELIEKKSYEIVPIEETIEYNGNKYNKQAFEQAIDGLEIV